MGWDRHRPAGCPNAMLCGTLCQLDLKALIARTWQPFCCRDYEGRGEMACGQPFKEPCYEYTLS